MFLKINKINMSNFHQHEVLAAVVRPNFKSVNTLCLLRYRVNVITN